jgi:hypothetical protein
MTAARSRMGADGPMLYLIGAKKGLQPTNQLGRRDAGRFHSLKNGPVTEPARPLVHGSLVGPLVQTGLMLVF